ncbi:MAG: RidA family protein [Gemmatimonadetes bacterium]|nr:RidA family protein [Gemmatimonadota bacterium]
MTLRILHPEGWAAPKGYANGVLATGRQIHVAGQIGWDAEQRIAPGGLVPQTRQALENIVAVLASGGARPEHLVRLTWYLTDRAAYLAASKEIGAAYRDVIGRHFPAMTAVEVSSLMEADALVEIEATAVLP